MYKNSKGYKLTLHPESPLRFLPKEMSSKQFMIFDSLRFTLEMLDYCIEELVNCLEDLKDENQSKIHYKVFNYIFSIIDHIDRFKKLYFQLDLNGNCDIEKLKYIYPYRNAIQHIDRNLFNQNVKVIENKRPIYGMLKWIVFEVEKSYAYTSVLVTGFYEGTPFEFKVPEQSGYPTIINNIIFETNTLDKSVDNEINITQLIDNVSEIVEQIDKMLYHFIKEKRLTQFDWSKFKDVHFIMKG